MALNKAELHDGKKIGHWDIATEVAADAAGLNLDLLGECAKTPAVEARVRKSTAEFHALQVTQRPTFVIDSPIGDRAVFSGFAKAAPMAATLDAMWDDIVGYESYAAHFGDPPA
jgi:predicted DsbA family dithiol-disulfide isomerase